MRGDLVWISFACVNLFRFLNIDYIKCAVCLGGGGGEGGAESANIFILTYQLSCGEPFSLWMGGESWLPLGYPHGRTAAAYLCMLSPGSLKAGVEINSPNFR